MNNNNSPILIIDSMNIFLRGFCASNYLTTKGIPAGGIYYFFNLLKRVIYLTKPSKIFCIWEGEKGSVRKRQIFSEYKEKRKPARLNRFYEDADIPINHEENKAWQNYILIELLKKIPLCQTFIDGTEADDIIAFISKYKFQNQEKIILSNDKDFYQILNDKVKIYDQAKKIFITKKDVIEKFNIHPNNFCLARTLVGDTSDNINGIKGCGLKTVAKTFPFLKESSSKTIHDIFNICEEQEKKENKKKIYKNILENKDIVVRNWKLMNLDTQQLSQIQINKINFIIDNFVPKSQKMEFIKILFKADLQRFDTESLFNTIATSPLLNL